MSATEVSPSNPVSVSKGDRVTLHVEGPQLAPGGHQLEVELTEQNLGALSFFDRRHGRRASSALLG